MTPALLHNFHTSPNQVLKIQLEGTRSNRDAIGARVAVQVKGRRMVSEVRSGGSFCSQNSFSLHFGLGSAPEDPVVEVLWPSGNKEVVKTGAQDRWIVIKEGKGFVSTKKFGAPPKLKN